MSYYLATFGPRPDLVGIRGVGVAEECSVPRVGQATMRELVLAYNLGNTHFVVDETGDTAHELLEEAWPLPTTGAVLEATRLDELLRRAESSGAAVAVWDATWSPGVDGPPTVFPDYSTFRKYLASCASLWEISGVMCMAQRAAPPPQDGSVA